MTRTICLFFLGLIAVPVRGQYDTYGGWLKLKGRKTGFFHTEQIRGRWWLVTPEGSAFFAKGVETVDLGLNRNIPPEEAKKVAAERAQQLKGWGFNSTGSQRTRLPGIPYALNLGLASASTPKMWLLGIVPDYFSPEFREAVERRAAELCPGLANDPWLIGYYTDNEIRWVPDIRSKDSVLEAFLKKDPGSPGYQKAVAFLKEHGRTPETLTDDDRAGFLEIAATEYGRIAHAAIRRHDKNHLILGSRFNSRAPIPLSRGLAPYYDVFSFNNYEHRAPLYKLGEIARVTGKPTMVTEFSFKAMDSGLYNTIGAGEPVATQQDRADLFAAYVQDLARLPSCLGYFWFKYRDQPKEGAGKSSPGGWGGENSNYGLVKLDGSPWTLLVKRMTEVNAGLEALAAKSGQR
jgi:agarase